MDAKKKTLLAITLVFFAFIGTVSAATVIWKYSNSVTFTTADYTLTLTYATNGTQTTLSAHVVNPQGSPLSGGTVFFWETTNTDPAGSSLPPLGTAVTNGNGDAVFTYTAPDGSHTCKAGYQVA